jgi:hypothetical protein
MAKDTNEENPPAVPAQLQLKAEPPTMLDGKVHVGVAIGLRTGDRPSALVVPDVLGVGKGESPVYLAKPLKIELEKILDYLNKKQDGIKDQLKGENSPVKNFLKNTSVAIDSFYFKKGKKPEGATEEKGELLLMQFALNFAKEGEEGGLIGNLTGDNDLSEMFDITGLSLRVLRCDKDNVEVLQNYVDGLSK